MIGDNNTAIRALLPSELQLFFRQGVMDAGDEFREVFKFPNGISPCSVVREVKSYASLSYYI
jgi:hypothetical protein